MSNFMIYMIGVLMVAIALAYGASLLGLSSTWIGVGFLLVMGLGIMAAIARTRRREPSQTE